MKNILPDLEKGLEIESLEQYLKIVGDLNKSTSGSTRLFFRGQEADCWKVEPSVFRDDMLSVEHILMQEPLRQIPSEFKGMQDDFEIMTKYQHYGMCTRLLDLTTNPLVALYFACYEHSEEEYWDTDNRVIRQMPYGIVFYKEGESVLVPSNVRVKIISALARYDMDGGMTIKEALTRLSSDGIIDENRRDRWCTKEGIEEFIKIAQNAYLVSPTLSNERLVRQSGIFLLPGRFNFSILENDISNGRIEKSECDLRDEFKEEFLYISPDNKKIIREELDACNINEANLFPELEHQLYYIKQINSAKARMVSYYEKFQGFAEKKSEVIISVETLSEEKKLRIMKDKISSIISESILAEQIFTIIKNNMVVDWYKRAPIISKMRKSVLIELMKEGFDEVEGRKIAQQVVSEVRDMWIYSDTKE